MACLTCKIDSQVYEKAIERANTLGLSRSEYLRSLVENDLFPSAQRPLMSKETGEAAPNASKRPDYGNLPENYDGSPHLFSIDLKGDARTDVKYPNGKVWTWVKRKGSNEWMVVGKIIQ